MSARRFRSLAALGVVLAALPLRAAAAEVLTLDRALAIAEEHNRDVLKAVEYQNWIRGRYVEERAQALPQIALGAGVRRDYDETFYLFSGGLFPKSEDTAAWDVSLSQSIYSWGKVPAAIRGARLAVEAGGEQLRAARQAARRAVTTAFYDVVLAGELLTIADENLKQKERHLDEARKKLELGTATDYDVLAAEVAAENARPTVIRAANDIRTAKKRLLFLLGREEAEIDVEGSLDAPEVPLPEYDDAVRDALANRPELKSQQVLVLGDEALVLNARAAQRPHLDLNGYYTKKSISAGDFEIRPTTWYAALTIGYPIFDGLRTRGKVMQARSSLDSDKLEEAKLRDSITLEVRLALDAAREAAAILSALGGTVGQAERLVSMAEKGFEFGVKTRLDVDDAQLNLIQARANRARARRDYLVALNVLRWVQGMLGE
jgi:hydrophobic/amphiphilic exporter-1 (mainly G- bacteria), HAE1 family